MMISSAPTRRAESNNDNIKVSGWAFKNEDGKQNEQNLIRRRCRYNNFLVQAPRPPWSSRVIITHRRVLWHNIISCFAAACRGR